MSVGRPFRTAWSSNGPLAKSANTHHDLRLVLAQQTARLEQAAEEFERKGQILVLVSVRSRPLIQSPSMS